MNNIVLIGRLTKEPDLRYTQSGKAVANFTLAVNREYTRDGEQKADFINIQVWGKPAENAAQYLKKGSKAAVNGRLQIREYTDNNNQRRWQTEVIANRVEFLDSKNSNAATFDDSAEKFADDFGVEIEFADDELPF